MLTINPFQERFDSQLPLQVLAVTINFRTPLLAVTINFRTLTTLSHYYPLDYPAMLWKTITSARIFGMVNISGVQFLLNNAEYINI